MASILSLADRDVSRFVTACSGCRGDTTTTAAGTDTTAVETTAVETTAGEGGVSSTGGCNGPA